MPVAARAAASAAFGTASEKLDPSVAEPTSAAAASSPEASVSAGASVSAPSEVRVWFTQEPQDGTVRVRILEAAKTLDFVPASPG